MSDKKKKNLQYLWLSVPKEEDEDREEEGGVGWKDTERRGGAAAGCASSEVRNTCDCLTCVAELRCYWSFYLLLLLRRRRGRACALVRSTLDA